MSENFTDFTDLDELRRLVRERGMVRLAFDDKALYRDARDALKDEFALREFPLPIGGALEVREAGPGDFWERAGRDNERIAAINFGMDAVWKQARALEGVDASTVLVNAVQSAMPIDDARHFAATLQQRLDAPD